MNYIFHITTRAAWQTAKNLGTYRSDSLATEGFIHCSTITQVKNSADRFFQDQQDLVILSIDPNRVTAEIRNEGTDPTNLFPHIYGELNIDAVTKVTDLEPPITGKFSLPADLTIAVD